MTQPTVSRHQAQRVASSMGQRIDTLRVLVGRELRTRYKGSFFGMLWAILSPLGTVVVLEFVFSNVLDVNIPHFGAFIYSGLLPWVWFAAAVQTGANALNDNRDLVRTPFFSKPLLPAVITCANFLLYLFALPVLLLLLVVDGVALTGAVFALPVIWVAQGILTLAITVFIAAIGVIIRDVQHLMGVVLLFWFYLTPIFYELEQVPAEYTRWFELNPMTTMVSARRAVTLYGRAPDWTELGIWSFIGAILMIVSLLIFRSLEDAFVDQA